VPRKLPEFHVVARERPPLSEFCVWQGTRGSIFAVLLEKGDDGQTRVKNGA